MIKRLFGALKTVAKMFGFDMRLRVLNFGNEAPGNFTRRIRARVLRLSLPRTPRAFLTKLRAVSLDSLR